MNNQREGNTKKNAKTKKASNSVSWIAESE